MVGLITASFKTVENACDGWLDTVVETASCEAKPDKSERQRAEDELGTSSCSYTRQSRNSTSCLLHCGQDFHKSQVCLHGVILFL